MTSLATADLAHTLIALAAILLCAHGMGSLFVRFRQPRAIGEILGGLLLGATVLGWLWPSAQSWMFPTDGSTLGHSWRGVPARPAAAAVHRRVRASHRLSPRGAPHRGGRVRGRHVHPVRRRPWHLAGDRSEEPVGPERQHDLIRAGVLDRPGDHQYPGDLADHARHRHPRHRVRARRPGRGRARGSRAVRGARRRHRLRRRDGQHPVRPAVCTQHHRRLEAGSDLPRADDTRRSWRCS